MSESKIMTATELLDELSECEEQVIREMVASHRLTSGEALDELAKRNSSEYNINLKIIRSIINNPNVLDKTLNYI